MAHENRLWGAERIHGELLKLGLTVAKHTIQKYIARVRPTQPASPTWSTFLKNHAKDIWACDFLPVIDAWFRPLYLSSSSIWLHDESFISGSRVHPRTPGQLSNCAGRLRSDKHHAF